MIKIFHTKTKPSHRSTGYTLTSLSLFTREESKPVDLPGDPTAAVEYI